jgi:CPA1 family monovalent cation:H+ antiporter
MASNTYELPTANDTRSDKHHAATRLRGKRLFSSEINYEDLLSWLDEGAEVRSTSLTEEFTIDIYRETYQDRFIALFVVENSGRLRVVIDQADFPTDCKIISLIKPDNI